MALSVAEVRKIARLARINLTSAEEKRHAQTISEVLEYMKILNEVDTSGVEITAQVTGLENVVRSDVVSSSPCQKEILSQLPKIVGDELAVPGVFNEE